MIVRTFYHVQKRWISISNMCLKTTPKNLKGKGVSSQMWLRRQLNDPYVKRARIANYRCRSAFKLLEIDDRFGFLKPGTVVIDCGAAPGSWTQVAVERVNSDGHEAEHPKGIVISVDLQHMVPIEGAKVIHEADFTKLETQKRIMDILVDQKVGVVISDMAPKATGIKSMDHENIVDLCVAVLELSEVVLKPGGTILCKLWQGGRQQQLQIKMKSLFETVKIIKPKSSRTDSAEIYLYGSNYIGLNAKK